MTEELKVVLEKMEMMEKFCKNNIEKLEKGIKKTYKVTMILGGSILMLYFIAALASLIGL